MPQSDTTHDATFTTFSTLSDLSSVRLLFRCGGFSCCQPFSQVLISWHNQFQIVLMPKPSRRWRISKWLLNSFRHRWTPLISANIIFIYCVITQVSTRPLLNTSGRCTTSISNWPQWIDHLANLPFSNVANFSSVNGLESNATATSLWFSSLCDKIAP